MPFTEIVTVVAKEAAKETAKLAARTAEKIAAEAARSGQKDAGWTGGTVVSVLAAEVGNLAEGAGKEQKAIKEQKGDRLPREIGKPMESDHLPKEIGKPAESDRLPREIGKPVESDHLPKEIGKPMESDHLPKEIGKPTESDRLPIEIIEPVRNPNLPHLPGRSREGEIPPLEGEQDTRRRLPPLSGSENVERLPSQPEIDWPWRGEPPIVYATSAQESKPEKTDYHKDVGDQNETDPDRIKEEDIPGKKGGSYRDVYREGEGEFYEVHHMPADSASTLERNDGPAIRMEKADHRQTASCGSSREAREYQTRQRELIEQGKFREALQMDIDDIHEKFGDKYDDAIAEMLEYVDQLEKEGKING